MPNCALYKSDCEDLKIINTLDGFNLQPRLSIPFDGAIDLRTVTSKTVFIIRLGNTLQGRHEDECHGPRIRDGRCKEEGRVIVP